jgi:hypothetical protein
VWLSRGFGAKCCNSSFEFSKLFFYFVFFLSLSYWLNYFRLRSEIACNLHFVFIIWFFTVLNETPIICLICSSTESSASHIWISLWQDWGSDWKNGAGSNRTGRSAFLNSLRLRLNTHSQIPIPMRFMHRESGFIFKMRRRVLTVGVFISVFWEPLGKF